MEEEEEEDSNILNFGLEADIFSGFRQILLGEFGFNLLGHGRFFPRR